MGWVGVMANQVPFLKEKNKTKPKSLFLASKQNKTLVHQEIVCYTFAEVCFDQVCFRKAPLFLLLILELELENNLRIATKKNMFLSSKKDKDKLIINYIDRQVKWISEKKFIKRVLFLYLSLSLNATHFLGVKSIIFFFSKISCFALKAASIRVAKSTKRPIKFRFTNQIGENIKKEN